MGVRLLYAGLATLLLMAVGASLLGLKFLRPEVTNPQLRTEWSAVGLTVGESTAADMVGLFGPPEGQQEETLATRFEYPQLGLSLRFGKPGGLLQHYEFDTPLYTTGKGIRIGSTQAEVLKAYGRPTETTPLSGATRMRYIYGYVYVLEFWFGQEDRLERVSFFRT